MAERNITLKKRERRMTTGAGPVCAGKLGGRR
jgi:hypothetical protein